MANTESANAERSWIEAGLFGCAVIHAVVAAVMLAGWAFVSALAGDFRGDEFAGAGAFVSVLALLYWLSSRIVRTLRSNAAG